MNIPTVQVQTNVFYFLFFPFLFLLLSKEIIKSYKRETCVIIKDK